MPDLLTLDEAKKYLRIGKTSEHDAELPVLISAVSEDIRTFTGFDWLQQTMTEPRNGNGQAALTAALHISQGKKVVPAVRLVVVKTANFAGAPAMPPRADNARFEPGGNHRPRPQHDALQSAINDFDHAVAPPTQPIGIAVQVVTGLEEGHKGRG